MKLWLSYTRCKDAVKRNSILFLLLLICHNGIAQSTFTTVGDAVNTGTNCYRLTTAEKSKKGAVWNNNKINLNQNFDISFSLNFGNISSWSGGDGMAFVLQPVNVSQIGNGGSAKGYGNTYLPNGTIDIPGIAPSLDIEYDTYDDYGGTTAFAALLLNGDYRRTPANTGVGQVPIGFVTDGLDHTSRVTWNVNTKTMTLYFDGVQKFTYNNDIVNTIFSGQNLVYFGFTGATGGSVNQQSVCINTALTIVNQVPVSLPTPTISASGPTTFCAGGSVNLSSSSAAKNNLQFNGTNYVEAPSTTANSLTSALTVEAWVKTDDPNQVQYIVSKGTNDQQDGQYGVLIVGGKFQFHLWQSGGHQGANGVTPIVAGQWYHISGTWDGITTKIYVNGILEGQAPLAGPISANPGPLEIGRLGLLTLPYSLYGEIDEVRIWNIARTASEIQLNMNRNVTANTSLVAYYKLDEGTGTTTADAANENTASLINSPSWKISGAPINYAAYAWSTGANTPTITANTAGSYSVTVTDVNGNAGISAPVNVSILSASANITASGPTLFCPGGAVVLTASAGNSYLWSNGATTQSITVTASGSYTVTVTNASGCSATSAATIVTVNPLPAATNTKTDVTCIGGNDGSISVTALNGTPIYQYSKDGGVTYQYSNIFSGLTAGIYNIVVQSATGCVSAVQPVTVNVIPDVTPPVVITQNITVSLNANGIVTINPAQVNNGSYDNCGIVSMSVSPSSFNCNDVTGGIASNCSVDAQYNASATNANSGPNGQTFKPLRSGKLERIEVISYNPTQLRVREYVSTDLSTAFTGNILATSISANGASNFPGFTSFAFSNPPSLVAGRTYIFEVVGSGTVYHHIPGGYPDGTAVSPTNSTFDRDIPFKLYICPVGVQTTLSVTDNKGNTSTGIAMVTVVDLIAPTISCPQPISVQCASAVPAPDVNLVTATDNCSVVVSWLGDIISNQISPNKYIITRTYQAIDPSGNKATCSQIIKVEDNISPVPVIAELPTIIGQCSAIASTPKATDNCAGTINATTLDPVSFSSQGVYSITWTYNDGNGNSTIQTQNVIVKDNVPPTISCPIDMSVVATSSTGAIINYTTPVGTDNCSGATTVRIAGPASGSTFPIGVTTITYQVSDGAGNTAQCSFTVTVNGITPQIVCPANFTVNNTPGQCGANVGFAATETIGIPASTITYSKAPGSFFNVGTTIVTATATNAVGTSSCSFTVTITDNERPIVTCPANQVFCANANGSLNYNIPILQQTDNCGIASITYVVSGATSRIGTGADASGSFLPGISTVTWTVGDIHGNSSVCSFTITVNPLPVIGSISATSNNVCEGAILQLTNTSSGGTWSVSDNSIANISSAGGLVTAIKSGSTSVMYSITNGNGCTSAVSFSLTVNPSPAVPVIIPNGPIVFCPQGSVLLSASVQQVNGVTYAWLPANGVGSTLPNYLVSVTGNYSVTVTNPFGCATTSQPISITVQDILPPVPSMAVLPDLVLLPNTVIAPPVATDNCKIGLITATSTDPLSYNDAGKYTIHWQYDDGNGNTSAQIQQITILDIVPPDISCIPSITQKNDPAQPGAIVKYSLPFMKDNSSSVTISVSEGYGDGAITFNTPLSFNVKNLNFISSGSYNDIAHGHGISINVTVELFNPSTNQWIMVQSFQTGTGDYHFGGTVIDFPVISQVSKIRFTTGQPIGAALHFYALQVNLNSITLVQQSGLASGSFFPLGNTLNRFEATDEAGNKNSCQFTVTVTDNEKPKILNVVSSIKFATSNCAWSGSGASINLTDNSNDPLQLTEQYYTASGYQFISNQFTTVAKGNYQLASRDFPVGVNTVVLSIRDASGNVSDTVSFTVTVKDNIAPTISPSGNISRTTDPGICGAYVKVPLPVTLDNCTIQKIENSFTGNASAVASYPVGTTLITWTVTDVSGNKSTATQTVTVTDQEAPVIYNIPVNIIQTNDAGSCGAKVIWPAVIATDNCRVASFLTNHQSGETFPLGVTTVTFTATDIHGNTASASFTITVTDNEAPRVITKPVTVTLVNGSASILISDIDGGTLDNCGTVNLSASQTQFSCANTGINNITLTATDSYGNTASAIATVTVIGMVPNPVIQVIPANAVYTGGVPTDIYLGYGPQSVSLSTSVPTGNTVTYSWSGLGLSCYNCANPVFTAVTSGSYSFTVVTTNQYGCSASASITICVRDIRVTATTGSKVYVCHTDLLTGAVQTLSMAVNSVATQLFQNPLDKLGSCGMPPCSASASLESVLPPANSILGKTAKPTTELDMNQSTDDKLVVTASPNPSHEAFRILVKTRNQLPVHIRMIDNYGRITESLQNAPVGKTFRMGERLMSGIYFAEVIQGKQRVVIKLIKQ